MIIFDKSSSILSTGTQVIRPKQKANLAPTPFLLENVLKIPNYFKLKKNIFSPSSLVVKKEVFKKAGVFDETINYGEEEDFIIRVFSIFSLTHYHTAKVYYLKGLNDQLTSPNSKIKRVHPNYSKYLNNTNKQVLKPYIDFIYFKLVVLYKMQRNYKLVKTYKEKIDASNLSVVRKIKYHLPTNLFFILKSCYLILKK